MKLVEQVSPFFGVVSAALIFLSWMISTIAVGDADDLEKRLTESLASQDQYDFRMQVDDQLYHIQRKLVQIEMRSKVESEAALSIEPRDVSNLARVQAFEFECLSDMASSTAQMASFLPNRSGIRLRIGETQRKVDSSVAKSKMRLKHIENSVIDDNVQSNGTFPKPLPGRDALFLTIEGFQEAYAINLRAELDSEREEAIREISTAARGARERASFSRCLTYGVFAFGTLLAIFGKLIELRRKRREASARVASFRSAVSKM